MKILKEDDVYLSDYDSKKPLNIVTTIIKKYFKGKCIDVGYNNGRHLCLMPKGGVGIDIDARFDKNLKDYKLIRLNLNKNKIPLKENQFDTLLCSHVLERLDSPHLILKEFQRIVKPNGIIILAVPNARCIHKDFYKGKWAKYHINAWDRDTFKKTLEVHNLKIIKFLVNHPTKSKFIGNLFQLIPLKKRWEDLWFVCKNAK